MYVQFYRTTNEGKQEKAGQARMEDGRVFFIGVSELITSELKIYGILYDGEVVFPEEGERF
jgi:hypothetical protein